MPLNTNLTEDYTLGQTGHVAMHEETNTRVNAIATNVNAHEAATDPHAILTSTGILRTVAGTPDALITGTITRDSDGAAISAPVTWPDATPGTYTATVVSTAFPGAVDAYTITYGSPVAKTCTQSVVTRDTTGAVTARPAITVA